MIFRVGIERGVKTGYQCAVTCNRPHSYSIQESQSNDVCMHFVEFSNVHNSDGSSGAIRLNLAYKSVLKMALDPDSFVK